MRARCNGRQRNAPIEKRPPGSRHLVHVPAMLLQVRALQGDCAGLRGRGPPFRVRALLLLLLLLPPPPQPKCQLE